MNKKELRKYANLIAVSGANIQEGQQAIITASVDDAYFVRMVQEECYKAGASRVTVDWTCDEVTEIDYRYADTKTLQEFPKWKEAQWKYKQKHLPAMIYIESSDPDAASAIDQKKMADVRRALTPKIWKYRQQMEDHYQWTIVGLPGEKWAKKLFPGLSKKAAMNKLWEAIRTTARLEGDANENWKKHCADLTEKCRILNEMNIQTLIYKNSLGTDFRIDLIPNTNFCAGEGITREGIHYNPNMPTEECFTSPDKSSANGTVMASLPLSLMGKVIRNFGFVFENGKVIKIIAESEEDRKMLEDLTSMDEGAARLGEVALVPFDSPVNQTGILFFNTLFDENAACHLALGRGFEEVIKDVENKTPEEIAAFGINESYIHTDFMIGTADLEIIAITRDGKELPVFRNGVFAF